jgi:hypothetical protein
MSIEQFPFSGIPVKRKALQSNKDLEPGDPIASGHSIKISLNGSESYAGLRGFANRRALAWRPLSPHLGHSTGDDFPHTNDTPRPTGLADRRGKLAKSRRSPICFWEKYRQQIAAELRDYCLLTHEKHDIGPRILHRPVSWTEALLMPCKIGEARHVGVA